MSAPSWRLTAPAGIAAAAVGIGLGEAAAGLVGASPIGAVAGVVIDLSPAWLREFVISVWGSGDRVVLVIALLLVVLVVSAVAGVAESRLPPWGSVLLAALGATAAVCAATRADAGAIGPVPSVLAAAAAVAVVRLLVQLADRTVPPGVGRPSVSRRAFLATSLAAAGVGAFAAVVARASSQAVDTARRAIRLPRAADPAPPVPAAASLGIPGVAPLITPNPNFYRVDTAVFLPVIDAGQWRLRVTGMVEREIELTYDQLLALPLVERRITLMCVSNPVGGPLISNATWLGYPLRSLLARARPLPDADMVLSKSSDGFTAGTPLSALTDGRDALLAVGMNGQALPREHGFPARLVVPGLYGYVSATKWVVELNVTRFDRASAYWTDRGWGEKGPIKLSSRIDVPRRGDRVARGDVTVAGVAWLQHVGISKVEVSVDGGSWQQARLAEQLSPDTWRQWSWTWRAEPGSHTLRVRATDAKGNVQDATLRDVVPDGATGLHTISVEV